jgi:hypothetical protein
MKIQFNRMVFITKGQRFDVLITVATLPFIPLWLLVHITRFAEFKLDSDDGYQDYIESNLGRSRSYGAITDLKI